MNNEYGYKIPNNAFTLCLKIFSAIAVTVTAITLSGGFLFIYLLNGQYIGLFAGLCIAILLVALEVVAPLLLVKKLVKPLKEVVNASSELAKGNLSVTTEYHGGVPK